MRKLTSLLLLFIFIIGTFSVKIYAIDEMGLLVKAGAEPDDTAEVSTGGSVSVTDEEVYSGTSAYKVVNGEYGTFVSAYFDPNLLEVGKKYIATVKIKAIDLQVTPNMYVFTDKGSEDNYQRGATGSFNTSEWVEFSYAFIATSVDSALGQQNRISVGGFPTGGPTMNFYADDLCLYELRVTNPLISGNDTIDIGGTSRYVLTYTNPIGTDFGFVNSATSYRLENVTDDGITIDPETGVVSVASNVPSGATADVVGFVNDEGIIDANEDVARKTITVTKDPLIMTVDADMDTAEYTVSSTGALTAEKSTEAFSGESSWHLSGTTGTDTDRGYGPELLLPEQLLQPGVRYFAEAKIKLPQGMTDTLKAPATLYAFPDNNNIGYVQDSYNADEWKTIGVSFIADGTQKSLRFYNAAGWGEFDFLVDDLKLYELRIMNPVIEGPGTFPGGQEATYTFRAENQCGSELGFTNRFDSTQDVYENIVWRLENASNNGFSMENGVLSIRSSVPAGATVDVVAYANVSDVVDCASAIARKTVTAQAAVADDPNLIVRVGGEADDFGAPVENSAVTTVTDDVYAGATAYRVQGNWSFLDVMLPEDRIIPGKRYIVNAKVKQPENPAVGAVAPTVYVFTDKNQEEAYQKSIGEYTNTGWKDFSYAFIAQGSNSILGHQNRISFGGYNMMDFLIDDIVCYELAVEEISLTGKEEIDAPETAGETASFNYVCSASNQWGNSFGLNPSDLVWSISENYEGITIEPDMTNRSRAKLIVAAEAPDTEITLQAKYENEAALYPDASASIKIKINSSQRSLPQARNIKIAGTLDSTLTGSYEYFHPLNIGEGETTVRWMMAEDEFSEYVPIEGATDLAYTPAEEVKDKLIALEVTPKDADGTVGFAALSEPVAVQRAPVAKDLAVVRTVESGMVKLYADYEYYDVNGDEMESASFRWFLSDSENGTKTPVSGFTDQEIVPDESFIDKYVSFEVTPAAKTGIQQGSAYSSSAIVGCARPAAEDVTISGKKKTGEILRGNYTYKNLAGDPEGKSKYEWKIDGSVVSTEASYLVKSRDAGKKITFTVTPVSSVWPYDGKTSAAASVSIGSSSGGSSGGGGSSSGSISGGGGGSISMITPVDPDPEKQERPPIDQTTRKFSDISGHWAENEIYQLTKMGGFSFIQEGTFSPDTAITRSEFAALIASALEVEEQQYTGIFSDVSADAFYAGKAEALFNAWIISGSDGMFRPDDSISREEAAKIAVQSCKYLNKTIPEGDISGFADSWAVAQWAQKYVASCVALDIMYGISETEFSPKSNVTRAQAAVIASRIIQGNAE